MGMSSDAQICFGILFPDDTEFPWDKEEYDWDITEWWYKFKGYKNPFEIYDESGNYIDDVVPPEEKVQEYYRAEREWLKDNPIPVELVNYQSDAYPAYIVAIPSTIFTANRGHPKELASQYYYDPVLATTLLNFCQEVGIHIATELPKWHLSSYYG